MKTAPYDFTFTREELRKDSPLGVVGLHLLAQRDAMRTLSEQTERAMLAAQGMEAENARRRPLIEAERKRLIEAWRISMDERIERGWKPSSPEALRRMVQDFWATLPALPPEPSAILGIAGRMPRWS
jgi:hypothetical protein